MNCKRPSFTFRKAVNRTIKGHLLQAKRRHIGMYMIVSGFHGSDLASEQFAFCEDIVMQGVGNIRTLARLLTGSTVWRFWWD